MQHANDLRAADQTVLNVMFGPSFQALPERYNRMLCATSEPLLRPLKRAIHHFIGAPKPWDLGAAWAHRNHALFADTIAYTYWADRRPLRGWKVLARTARISRRYWQAATARSGSRV